MPAPKGNKNAKGNKGGRRPTAGVEAGNTAAIVKVFNNDVTIKTLEAKIATGRYSPRDLWLLKALSGNERFLDMMADRNHPSGLPLGGDGKAGGVLIYIPGKKPIDESNVTTVVTTAEARGVPNTQ